MSASETLSVIAYTPSMVSIGLLEIFLAFIAFVVLCFFGDKERLPRNWPVVGMLPDTLLNLHRPYERIIEVLELTGGSFLYKGPWFTPEILNTVDPTNIHYVMSSNFSNFPKGSLFSKIFDILGDGIFNSDSDLWKNQRKFAQMLINHQGFHRFLVNTSWDKVEKGLIPVLEHVAKQGSVVDLQDLFQRFTLDVTSILVTGYDPASLSVEFPEVQFSKAMDDAEEAMFYRHIIPELFLKLQRWLCFGTEQKLKKARETLDHVLAEYVSRKREEMINKKSIMADDHDGVDLLTSYMSSEAEIMISISKSDDKFLRDTIMNFFLAGRDTTSSALTWFFWLVSQNPKVEAKIQEELKAAIPADKRAENSLLFNSQELNKLAYLHGALCETLRLYPPVPFQHKEPLQPDVLPSGHKVGPKMMVLFSVFVMGRMTSVWGQDCLEFKPERWISERGRIKHEPSYKFFAFNAGPRTCLGKEVAFTQMKAVAAAVIHNYHVQVVEGHSVTPSNSIILHMKHGLNVRITKRWF